MTRVIHYLQAGLSRIGLGHLVRNIAIAEALKSLGAESFFIIEAADDLSNILKELKVESKNFQQRIHSAAIPFEPPMIRDRELLIIDHYGYQQAISLPQARMLIIDEIPQEELKSFDMMLCFHPGTESFSRQTLKTKVELFGSAYIPIRKSIRQNELPPAAPEVKNIFLSLGGTSSWSELSLIIESASPIYEWVVLAAGLKSIDMPHQLRNRVAIYGFQAEPEFLYRTCDLAITQPSTTAYEIAASGVPMILLERFQNQCMVADAFHRFEAAQVIRSWSTHHLSRLAAGIDELGSDQERRQTLSRNAWKLVDGRGADRIAQAILSR